MNKRSLAYVVVSVVFFLTIAFSGAVVWKSRPIPLTDPLVDAYGRIERDRHPRAVHRDPSVPGRFGDEIHMQLGAIASVAKAATDMHECVRLTQPKVSPPCDVMLEATRAPLAAIMAATHRAEGGLLPDEGAYGPMIAPTSLSRDLFMVCKRSAREIQTKKSAGDVPGALQQCGDTIALGRDLASGGSLVWFMMGAGCIESFAAPACDDAVRGADPEPRHALARELETIRKGLPVLGDVVRDDMVVTWLRSCGGYLDDASVARLPPAARAISGELMVKDLGLLDRVQTRAECRALEDRTRFWLPLPAADVPGAVDAQKYREPVEKMERALGRLITAAAR